MLVCDSPKNRPYPQLLLNFPGWRVGLHMTRSAQVIRRDFSLFVHTPFCHRRFQLGSDSTIHAVCLTHGVIGTSRPTAMFVRASKSRSNVRTMPLTDWTALSAAPLEPFCCSPVSACSESPWMITLGCPTHRANAARLRLASGSLFPFFSRMIATICLYTVSMATKSVIMDASSSCAWLDF